MSGYIGEYPCTVDAKGRFLLPGGLKKQIPVKEQKSFIINRGMEKHLVIYTKIVWDKITAEINELNLYVKKNREFIRKFNRGATEIDPDGTNRLLIPKSLMEYAGIEKDLILFAYGNRIEVWAEKEYERQMKEESSDFATLAEEVMGKKKSMTDLAYHKPVMLHESIDALNIVPDGTYVDVTFGGGGHSRAILEKLGPKGRLIAFDRDADSERNDINDKRFTLVRHNYRYLKNFLNYLNVIPVDGLFADLGISSYQIDEASRGFSIRFDADLDMRMNREADLTAASVVNNYPEHQLVKIFSEYGEVFNAKTLARKIISARQEKKINRTGELTDLMSSFVSRQNESQYYAKVFQALRIEVNDELESLKEMLLQSAEVIKTGGRLAVLSYHSLEDRLVKNIINRGKFEGEVEKDVFGNAENILFRSLNKKPLEASDEEINNNPRARSAKLRIAERN